VSIISYGDIFVFLLETWLTNRNSRYKWKIVAMKIKMKIGKMQERSGNYRPSKRLYSARCRRT